MIAVSLYGGRVTLTVDDGVWVAPPGLDTLVASIVAQDEAARAAAGAYVPYLDAHLAAVVAERLGGEVVDPPRGPPPARSGVVF